MDLISRQAAIDSIAELQARAASKTELTVISKAWKRLKAIPSVEVEPTEEQIKKYILDHNLTHKVFEPVKRGKWIDETTDYENPIFRCSACGVPSILDAPYCSNCGAKMGCEEKRAKKGRWEPVTNGRGGHECSICHSYAPSYKNGEEHISPYCPYCGAKMDL